MALSKPGTSSDFDTGGAKRQVLRSQARGIIFRVYNFFKKCSNEEEREKIDFKKCQLLTSKASEQVYCVTDLQRGKKIRH